MKTINNFEEFNNKIVESTQENTNENILNEDYEGVSTEYKSTVLVKMSETLKGDKYYYASIKIISNTGYSYSINEQVSEKRANELIKEFNIKIQMI